MTKINFILPVFNEAENLPALLFRLESVAQEAQARFGVDIGYVFVDDGSTDSGFDFLKSYDFGVRQVILRRLSRNFGKEAALSAAIEASRHADAAVLMDSDLQHPPEMILEFIRIWQEQQVDSVYTYKSKRRQQEGLAKSLLARAFFWTINRDVRYHIPENAGDFRLISRAFMAALLSLPESERFMKGLYGWIGFRQTGVPFDPDRRLHGDSKFRLRNHMLMTIDAITSFSIVPLRLMALVGLTISLVSTAYGLFIVFERLFFQGTGSGIASVLVLISFFGGIQMIFFGVLGEYVGKAMLEAKRRPSYIVAQDEILNGDQK